MYSIPFKASKRPRTQEFLGSKYVATEKWETMQFNVDNWADLLHDVGVDECARRTLFLLAQCGDNGQRAANEVINKVLKMIADGTRIHNWSAYVHTNCKDARYTYLC